VERTPATAERKRGIRTAPDAMVESILDYRCNLDAIGGNLISLAFSRTFVKRWIV
jgi:hypothetical protein